MIEEKFLQIDVEAIIKSKSPKSHKKIPKFIIRYLKKILHQDEINVFLAEQKDVKNLDFVDASIIFLDMKIEAFGLENIPEEGKFIFVANHPLGGMESLAMMKIISQKHKNLLFLVNDLLMFLTPLKDIFISVNKLGSQSRQHVEQINNAYNSDNQILNFPAGLVSRKIKNKIIDLEWQKNFITKAIETKRDIIPMFVEGKNSNFFYNLANIRKFLKLKFNIEMIFLVNEMFKKRGQTTKLHIGKPINYTIFDKSKTPKEWAKWVKEITYTIKN